MYNDWINGLDKRHINNNHITINMNNVGATVRTGIEIEQSDHIYCTQNMIDHNGIRNSFSNKWGVGINMLNSMNSFIYRDSIINLNKGISVYGINTFSNIYCNYFDDNLNCIELNNSTIRNNYNGVSSFNITVHGNNPPSGYVARTNEFYNLKHNSCIFNNNKLPKPNLNKWILEATTKNSPKLVSNSKNKAFIFNQVGTYDCTYANPVTDDSNQTEPLERENLTENEITNFWNNYTTSKYNLHNGNNLNLNEFEDQILNLETLIDTGTITNINGALTLLQPINQIHTEIKSIFEIWVDYISHYDTFYKQPSKFQNFRVWTTDSTWQVNQIQTDTLFYRISYHPISDSIYQFLDSLSKFSPFKTKPSAFFARNLLSFAGYNNNYWDSFQSNGPYLSGRVTSNCAGGGVSGITVELFTEFGNATGITAITEEQGYFRFTDEETNSLDTVLKYYVRVYFPSDSNHISITNYLFNLVNDSLLNIDCIFPGPQPLSNQTDRIEKIFISPNPADHSLFIKNLPKNLEFCYSISNSIGKTLVSQQKIANPTLNAEINIQNLSEGLYFLSLMSNKTKESMTFKFTVNHQ